MAEENDLLWDHAGDVENDVLSADYKYGRSAFRQDGVRLTYEHAYELVNVLDNTKAILQSYIQQMESRVPEVQPPRRQCCQYLRRKILPKLSRNISVVTVILQGFNLMILTLIDIWPKKDDKIVMIFSSISMIILQLFNLIAIVYTSYKLARQMYKRKVNGILLAQNYLATILLFAGLYTLTYRIDKKSWKFVQEDLSSNPVMVVVLYSKFLFFSVSTATLCGSDNALPVEWYNCIFAAIQMLLSFVYFASILGQAITPKLSDLLHTDTRQQVQLPHQQSLRRGRRNYGSMSSLQSTAANSLNVTQSE
ncbi:uncharacterized protein LOC121390568 isoform X2 [Gigantopelta aegis]|uniref:uncharacterized protein LOC121390568 isoform X2 n=1 Tax=Gigantopelta aegis TaxID=1735272 RepID=UPI001B88BCB9|nr:uncharacterized protein LOC121390568 isoform X2 [Gigantopelta aegis]